MSLKTLMQIADVKIEFLGHDGFLIKNGKTIVIDPFNTSGNVGKADMILITHSHFDHCSIKDIQKFVKPGTIIVATPDAQSKIVHVEGVEMHPVEVGDNFELEGVKIEAVPAYNIKKEFHPKNEGWVGYVIKLGSVIVYHAGDTDLIPEMKHLTGYGKHGNHFVALLPVSGKYVMDVDEAFEAAKIIRPDLAIPMHYGSAIGTLGDAERFVSLCKEEGIDSRVLEKI